ncbi:hypothetical protein CR513_55663, partial [Mucuna pruriens]
MGVKGIDQPRHAKIRNPGLKIFIKKNVAGLHVPVYNVSLKTSPFHELIHKKPLLPNFTVTQQLNQVPMLNLPKSFHLSHELPISLTRHLNELLDGNNTTIFKLSLVHFTKPPRTYQTLRTETISRLEKMCKRQLPQRLLKGGNIDAQRLRKAGKLPTATPRSRKTFYILLPHLLLSLHLPHPIQSQDKSKHKQEEAKQANDNPSCNRLLLLPNPNTHRVVLRTTTWRQRQATKAGVVLISGSWKSG